MQWYLFNCILILWFLTLKMWFKKMQRGRFPGVFFFLAEVFNRNNSDFKYFVVFFLKEEVLISVVNTGERFQVVTLEGMVNA